jgi:hypothetical protein
MNKDAKLIIVYCEDKLKKKSYSQDDGFIAAPFANMVIAHT